MKFRTLQADEIDIRVQQIKKDGSGVSLLLYKDSRVDMDILDETCGIDGWKREHSRDNHNCIVSVWSDRLKQWISKEDVGTESFTEKEKGLASGSFKRACVNFGIGRELYSSPFIWINLDKSDVSEYKGKVTLKTKFTVKEIEYNDKRKICKLVLQDNKGKNRYTWNDKKTNTPPKPTVKLITTGQTKELKELLEACNQSLPELLKQKKLGKLADMTTEMAKGAIEYFRKQKESK